MKIGKFRFILNVIYAVFLLMFFTVLISFFLLYYGKFVNFAWGLDLLVSFLTLLASFANICLAALMYVIFRKIFSK